MSKRTREICVWAVAALLGVAYLLVTAWAVWAAGREHFMCGIGALGMMMFAFCVFLAFILKDE